MKLIHNYHPIYTAKLLEMGIAQKGDGFKLSHTFQTPEHLRFNVVTKDNLRAADAIDRIDRTFDEEYLKILLNRMVLKEGIDILFNSYLMDATVTEGTVESVTVANKSGRQTWYADYFVDATGDGDLAVLCGCNYQLGRIEDSLCQPMTLCFRMAGVDLKSFQEEKAEIQKLYNEWQAEGKIQNPRENVLTFAKPISVRLRVLRLPLPMRMAAA